MSRGPRMAKRKPNPERTSRKPRVSKAKARRAATLVLDARDRLENWHRKHHPLLLDTLNPGASPADIARLERTIKQPLPDDVRVSLSIHNGQPPRQHFFLFELDLLSTER